MITRLLLVCVGITAFCGSAIGQGAVDPGAAPDAPDYVTQAEFDAAIKQLSKQIADLAGTKPQPATLEQRVEELERAYAGVITTQKNQLDALDQITERDESGNYHWEFNANSQPARQQLRKALSKTTSRDGTLVVHNRMGYSQWIAVNNGRYEYIGAYESKPFRVPPGTVTTQLWGQRPVNWTIGLPDFVQNIDIKPDRPWPVYRPIVYDSPLYIDSGWVAAN